MPSTGVPPSSISGLSWLGELVTASLPSLPFTSHAHPLPNRLAAASPNPFLNSSTLLNAASMAFSRSPAGSPPFPFGAITAQKKVWFQCPPPLFRTAVCAFSGSFFRLASSSSIGLPAQSGASSLIALFRFVT
jgi:hypothetical protein